MITKTLFRDVFFIYKEARHMGGIHVSASTFLKGAMLCIIVRNAA